MLRCLSLICFLITTAFLSSCVFAQDPAVSNINSRSEHGGDTSPRGIIFKLNHSFNDKIDPEVRITTLNVIKNRIVSEYRLTEVRELFPSVQDRSRAGLTYRAVVPSDMSVKAILDKLNRDPDIEWAEVVGTSYTQPE